MAMGKTLTIYLAADLKKFNTGMSQAEGGLKGFGNSLNNMLGPALIGAGIAAGALATKLAVDGVKAAVEDEAAMAKLAQTMDNLGLAHDTKKVEDYIYQLERSLGIADTELRPAYDRLVRAIGDTEGAQKALSLALDVSAGSGKGLQQVTEALGKAYEGNTAGLSRLGAGIDSTILKTGDMSLITQTLSDTFAGQAKTAAGTYEGQIKRLSTAADNMKEAFGAGLLRGLGDTETATNNVVKAFEDLEPLLENTGAAVSTFASSALTSYTSAVKRAGTETEVTADQVKGLETSAGASGFVLGEIFASLSGPGSPIGVFLRTLGAVSDTADETADRIYGTADSMERLAKSTDGATYSLDQFLQRNGVKLKVIREENKDYKDLAARQREVNTYESIAIDTTTRLTGSRNGSSEAADKQAKAESRLTEAFQGQQKAVNDLAGQLSMARDELEISIKKVDDYAAAMQTNILSGVNLGEAFTSGKETGTSVVDGFNAMVEQANWFGGILVGLKAQNVDQSLIEYIASQGPEVGGKLGEAMLGDKGLLSSLNEKWVGVQETTKTLSMQLVPEFRTAGVEAGIQTVDSLADQLSKETIRLGLIGKNIAKPVGARFKAQFLKDIADAIKEVEAVQTAARAEKVAAALRREAAITEQAIAQGLTNLLRNADQRNGQSIAPVLM